jgi:hypothetical protein
MAMPVGSFVGSKSPAMNFLASASLVAGQVVVREATVGNAGEAATCASTTSVLNTLGIATDAVTYTAALGAEPNEITQANIVRLIAGPFEVYRFKIAGSGTTGVAISTANPGNILTNTVASATGVLISSINVGTIDMSGGLIKGRTGNNVGAVRKMVSDADNVSATVTMAFANAIAVGDTFIRVPFYRGGLAIQLTTNYVEANGIIATGTGGTFRITAVVIDEVRDIAYVDALATGHCYNN